MSDDNFPTNLMRAAVAYLQFQSAMTCAREMFSKSYFSLGNAERIAVDQAVLGHASMLFQALTPESLSGGSNQQQAGFLAGMRAGQAMPQPPMRPEENKAGRDS